MDVFLTEWLGCLALVAIILAFLLYNLHKRDDALARILLGYFCVCLAFIVIKWYFRLDLAVYDTEKYQAAGAQIAALLRADFWGNLPHILKPYWPYTLPLGILYFLFGTSELLGQLLNTVMGLGVIINLHRLAALWFNRKTADRTALFMALYPYGWVLGGTLNRDMTIAFCITLFFRLVSEVRFREGKGSCLWLYAAALASFFYMGLLRPPLLILGALVVFVYWVANHQTTCRRGRLYRLVRLSFVLLVLGLGSASFFLFGKYYIAHSPLEREATQFSDVDNMNQRLRISESAGSVYMKGVKYSSYKDVVMVMPLATTYFMFSPLPWQVTSPKQALGLLDSTWLVLVCIYFLKGVKDLYHHNRKLTLALLAFLLVGITTSSVLQANAGSAMRHRTMFSLLMFPVAVHGMMRPRRKKKGLVTRNSRVPWSRTEIPGLVQGAVPRRSE